MLMNVKPAAPSLRISKNDWRKKEVQRWRHFLYIPHVWDTEKRERTVGYYKIKPNTDVGLRDTESEQIQPIKSETEFFTIHFFTKRNSL